MDRQLTMGSLFDGLGGFMLAAVQCGIKPIWAAEIEPNCINITRRHFPEVMHVGSVTELKGDEIQPVDIITFGSPCQNLSVAGNRKGLAGEESGLFLEAIRIIEEMRESTNGMYPTFVVWENVPGAFSSNDRQDFRTVLEKITKAACIPMPGHKWSGAGMVRGGEVDTAWRVLNAEHWGVPQRRRRIYLVGDFRGQRAVEILFKPESVLGYPTQGSKEKAQITGNPGNGFNAKDKRNRSFIGADISHADAVVRTFTNSTPALLQRMGTGGNQVPIIAEVIKENVIPIRSETTRLKESNGLGIGKPGGPAPTLTANDIHNVFYEQRAYDQWGETETGATLKATGGSYGGGSENLVVRLIKKSLRAVKYIIRRLTPRECERLQGYPDDWTRWGADGQEIAETARYRAIGNSIAVPCAVRVFLGIVSVLERGNEIDRGKKGQAETV